MSERMFPIMDGPAIPWSLIEPHERQAIRNHDQTLQRLSERGGLSACEALAVLESKGWNCTDLPIVEKGAAVKRLNEMVESSARLELTRLRAENEDLRKALYNLCRATDLWNDAVQSIIGYQADTGLNGPLGEAKDLLSKVGALPTVEEVQSIYKKVCP